MPESDWTTPFVRPPLEHTCWVQIKHFTYVNNLGYVTLYTLTYKNILCCSQHFLRIPIFLFMINNCLNGFIEAHMSVSKYILFCFNTSPTRFWLMELHVCWGRGDALLAVSHLLLFSRTKNYSILQKNIPYSTGKI